MKKSYVKKINNPWEREKKKFLSFLLGLPLKQEEKKDAYRFLNQIFNVKLEKKCFIYLQKSTMLNIYWQTYKLQKVYELLPLALKKKT